MAVNMFVYLVSSSSEGGDTGPSGLGPRVTERPDYAQLHNRGTTGRDTTDPRGQGRGRGRDAAGGAPRGPLSDGVQELTVSCNAAAVDADERLSLGAFRLGGSTEPTAKAASTVSAADQLLAYEDYTLAPLRRLGISGKHFKQTIQKLAICATQHLQKIWQHRQKLLQQGTSAAMRAGIG